MFDSILKSFAIKISDPKRLFETGYFWINEEGKLMSHSYSLGSFERDDLTAERLVTHLSNMKQEGLAIELTAIPSRMRARR